MTKSERYYADFEKKLSEIRKRSADDLLKIGAPLNKVDVLAKDIMELMVGRNVVVQEALAALSILMTTALIEIKAIKEIHQ